MGSGGLKAGGFNIEKKNIFRQGAQTEIFFQTILSGWENFSQSMFIGNHFMYLPEHGTAPCVACSALF